MGKRIYNILFHTHTVSGIVISAGLYVIFFTGSFSFFRDEIISWERNQRVSEIDEIRIDFDAALDTLESQYPLQGREIGFAHYYNEGRVSVNIAASKDTLSAKEAQKRDFFYLNESNFEKSTYRNGYSLGEFLYRLHFFAQIPYPFGYYLSGAVAFFFLFAIITGILVHWNKIISNFYLFRPWAKLKTLWTDAHTALGVIGLPFQFVYAVTGAFFMLNLIFVAPVAYLFFDGDRDKLYDELGYSHPEFVLENQPLETSFSVDEFVNQTQERWEGFRVGHVILHNYGDRSMHITVEGKVPHKDLFSAEGHVVYQVATGDVVEVKDPFIERSYMDGVKATMHQLHFGDYGGYGLRIISFILGLISCFVIISGVMIWLVARNRKDVSDKQKRFNEWVARIYLAICLSLYPVTAMTFIAVQVWDPAGRSFIYQFYFISWLILSILFTAKGDNYFTNKYTLISGAVIGFFVPVANGIRTGNWLWESLATQDIHVFMVDSLWLTLSIAALFAVVLMEGRKKRPT